MILSLTKAGQDYYYKGDVFFWYVPGPNTRHVYYIAERAVTNFDVVLEVGNSLYRVIPMGGVGYAWFPRAEAFNSLRAEYEKAIYGYILGAKQVTLADL